VLFVLAATLVLIVTTGAAAGSCDTIAAGDTGTVVERKVTKGRGYHFVLTIDADHGPEDTARVSPEVYETCHRGDRWPSCKED
jgi:hypothetical protein